MTEDEIRSEALKRWIADGWLEQDFEEKGALYRYGVQSKKLEAAREQEDIETLCVCGHEEQDHHTSWIPNGYKLVEECEWFGSNETGGMELVDGKWIDHCQRFRKMTNE